MKRYNIEYWLPVGKEPENRSVDGSEFPNWRRYRYTIHLVLLQEIFHSQPSKPTSGFLRNSFRFSILPSMCITLQDSFVHYRHLRGTSMVQLLRRQFSLSLRWCNPLLFVLTFLLRIQFPSSFLLFRTKVLESIPSSKSKVFREREI